MEIKNELTILVTVAMLVFVPLTKAQEPAKLPTHDMSSMKQEEMNKRGDKVMGFDHTKTTHHFILDRDGGAIEVNANETNDLESRDEIRGHLTHIASMFAKGNFNAPILIHEQNPPGATVMQKLKDEIKYAFEKTERGGRVRISTKNAEALAAIYEFLRFQIREHKTGDSLEVR